MRAEIGAEAAAAWLLYTLGRRGGSVDSTVLHPEAIRYGFGLRTLRRAAASLESEQRLVRLHHGNRSHRAVTYALAGRPPGSVTPPPCPVCSHPADAHVRGRDLCHGCYGVCRRAYPVNGAQ